MTRMDTAVTRPLPAGHTVRPPTTDDAQTIFDLFAAYNTEAVGFADLTIEDIHNNLDEPGLDIATGAWLVHDEAGKPVGYGCVYADQGVESFDIEAASADPYLMRWLLDKVIDRSGEIARERELKRVRVDLTVYRPDEPLRALANEYGFTFGTTFHRMRIDHTEPRPQPELPPGVTQRRGDEGEDVRRAAYDIVLAAFAGQFGFSVRPYDEWFEIREKNDLFAWSQLTVLELDGKPVAMRENNDQFVEDENCGYVLRLGVREEARGRGLAKFLLHQAFADDAAQGRDATYLHVDTNNPTPALGLYLSVGMRQVLILDVWRLPLEL